MTEVKDTTKVVGHTPAPWSVVVGSDPKDFIVAEAGGATICEPNVALYRGGLTFKELGSPARDISFEETQANARLIAAAPDLLAVLKELLEGTDFSDAARTRLALSGCAAIDKAEGREIPKRESAQVCGCDPGEGYTCAQHRTEQA